jgi:hypothetical protein
MGSPPWPSTHGPKLAAKVYPSVVLRSSAVAGNCVQTTFMNLLSGDLTPTSGESRRSHKLRIGRYAQVGGALCMEHHPAHTGLGDLIMHI